MYASNRAVTYHIIEDKSEENKANKAQLQRWNLTSGTNAYLCGFFFLFQPTHEVVKQFHKTWTKLSDPTTLKIGIHIRVGDYEFAAPHDLVKGRKQIQDYEDYFRCAQEIEDSRRESNQPVIWYVISDSLSIRLAAQEKFGSKVLIDRVRASHLDCDSTKLSCAELAQNQSLQLAVGEMLAFSLANVHIIGRASGYSRSGAWLSIVPPDSERQHIYDLPSEHIFGKPREYENRPCSKSNFRPPGDDAKQWSGVR
eukprot:gene24605-32045_t